MVTDWLVRYEGYDAEKEALREALCTLGNGHFATRGAAPETRADGVHYPGTYAAGVFNRLASDVDGQHVENESIVNLPNWLSLTFRVDGGDWFDVDARAVSRLRAGARPAPRACSRAASGSATAGSARPRVAQRRLRVHGRPPPGWAGHDAHRRELVRPAGGALRPRRRRRNAGVAALPRVSATSTWRASQATAVDGETVAWTCETTQSHVRVAAAPRTRCWTTAGSVAAQAAMVARARPDRPALRTRPRRGRRRHRREDRWRSTPPGTRRITEPGRGGAPGDAPTRPGLRGLLARHVAAWDHLWEPRPSRSSGPDVDVPARSAAAHVPPAADRLASTPPTSTSGCRRAGCTARRYRGTSSGTSCSSSRSSPCGCPSCPGRCCSTGGGGCRRRARRRATPATGARCSPGRAAATAARRRRPLHLNPRSGRWLPDNSRLQRHIGLAVAYNVWQYYEATGDLDFLAVLRRRDDARGRPVLGEPRRATTRAETATTSAA